MKMNFCDRPVDICLNLQVLFSAIAGIRFSKYLVLAEHEEPVIKFQLCASVSSVVAAPFILPNKAQRKMEQRMGTNVSGGENGTGDGWITGTKPNYTGSHWWIICGCFTTQCQHNYHKKVYMEYMHNVIRTFNILYINFNKLCYSGMMKDAPQLRLGDYDFLLLMVSTRNVFFWCYFEPTLNTGIFIFILYLYLFLPLCECSSIIRGTLWLPHSSRVSSSILDFLIFSWWRSSKLYSLLLPRQLYRLC